MHKINGRSKAPRAVEGPRVGAVVTPTGVTVRVLSSGERSPLPRSVVVADDDTADAVKRAASSVAEKIRAHARQSVAITVAI